ERSKFAGCTELATTTTPNNWGQPAALVAVSCKHAKPLEFFRLTKPVAPNGSTPNVTGLPASRRETAGRGTAWVRGLLGALGRQRTGNGVGDTSLHRSAAGLGG